jgi:Tfp pilus assembly protein PilF
VPPTSKAVMRAGLLAREGLLHDARRVVVAALDTDRDEPTLHLLLGDLYTRTGLADLAAESFDEAQFLLKK